MAADYNTGGLSHDGEIAEPAAWRAAALADLYAGSVSLYYRTVLTEVRWLAKRIAPPDVNAAGHVDELVERHGSAF